MNSATPNFEARLARLVGIVEQLSQRMGNLETRMDQGFREVNARMDSGFRWIVGIQFTTLVALGTLILFKL